jgi:hypothetical protein
VLSPTAVSININRENIMIMKTNTLILSAALAPAFVFGLAACDNKAGDAKSTSVATTEVSPVQLQAQINKAYMDNAIQAKRAWGGKHVTVGGTFDSSGRNTDGTISILLIPGYNPPTIAEFNVGKGRDDFVASLKKGDVVTLTCTVDPKVEGFSVTYIACVPAGQKK